MGRSEISGEHSADPAGRTGDDGKRSRGHARDYPAEVAKVKTAGVAFGSLSGDCRRRTVAGFVLKPDRILR